MTIAEFRQHNKLGTMPQNWIGQGYGYKLTEKEWNDLDDDEIIYIPEYGYEREEGKRFVERADAYTKRDFIQLIRNCDDKFLDIGRQGQVDRMAKELFEAVDWQYPESLLQEGFFEEE